MENSKNLRVLYAEDNDDACVMVTMLLGFADIDVTAVQTVAEAWQLAQTEDFDLYLLDSRFPEGSGLDLCRQLREYASQTPILFYSGDAFATDKESAQAAGASDYLTKPFIGDLAATVSLAVKMSQESIVKIPHKTFLESRKIDEVEMFKNVFENLTLTNRI